MFPFFPRMTAGLGDEEGWISSSFPPPRMSVAVGEEGGGGGRVGARATSAVRLHPTHASPNIDFPHPLPTHTHTQTHAPANDHQDGTNTTAASDLSTGPAHL